MDLTSQTRRLREGAVPGIFYTYPKYLHNNLESLQKLPAARNARVNKKSDESSAQQALVCNCKAGTMKCFALTPEDKRHAFDMFTKMSYNEQSVYLAHKCMKVVPIKRRSVSLAESRRKCSVKYFVTTKSGATINVCKKTICGIFHLTPRRIQVLVNKLKSNADLRDQRGKHSNRPNRLKILSNEHDMSSSESGGCFDMEGVLGSDFTSDALLSEIKQEDDMMPVTEIKLEPPDTVELPEAFSITKTELYIPELESDKMKNKLENSCLQNSFHDLTKCSDGRTQYSKSIFEYEPLGSSEVQHVGLQDYSRTRMPVCKDRSSYTTLPDSSQIKEEPPEYDGLKSNSPELQEKTSCIEEETVSYNEQKDIISTIQIEHSYYTLSPAENLQTEVSSLEVDQPRIYLNPDLQADEEMVELEKLEVTESNRNIRKQGNEAYWKDNRRKILKSAGKPYISRNGMYRSGKREPSSVPVCNCKSSTLRCHTLMQEQKKRAFTMFYEMSYDEQSVFLAKRCMQKEPVKKKGVKGMSRRQCTYKYFLFSKHFPVCQKTLCDVFSVTHRRIQIIQDKIKRNADLRDMRGRHSKHSTQRKLRISS